MANHRQVLPEEIIKAIWQKLSDRKSQDSLEELYFDLGDFLRDTTTCMPQEVRDLFDEFPSKSTIGRALKQEGELAGVYVKGESLASKKLLHLLCYYALGKSWDDALRDLNIIEGLNLPNIPQNKLRQSNLKKAAFWSLLLFLCITTVIIIVRYSPLSSPNNVTTEKEQSSSTKQELTDSSNIHHSINNKKKTNDIKHPANAVAGSAKLNQSDSNNRTKDSEIKTPSVSYKQQETNLLRSIISVDNIDRVHSCINRGADVNTQGENKLAPLHIAAITNDTLLARKILQDERVNINVRAENYITPLWYASKHNSYEVAKMILNFDTTGINKRALIDFTYSTALDVALDTSMRELIIRYGGITYDEIVAKRKESRR